VLGDQWDLESKIVQACSTNWPSSATHALTAWSQSQRKAQAWTHYTLSLGLAGNQHATKRARPTAPPRQVSVLCAEPGWLSATTRAVCMDGGSGAPPYPLLSAHGHAAAPSQVQATAGLPSTAGLWWTLCDASLSVVPLLGLSFDGHRTCTSVLVTRAYS
jgi:hypothetical protein